MKGNSIIKQYFMAAFGSCLNEGETEQGVNSGNQALLGQIKRGLSSQHCLHFTGQMGLPISSTCQLWRCPAAVLLLLSSA